MGREAVAEGTWASSLKKECGPGAPPPPRRRRRRLCALPPSVLIPLSVLHKGGEGQAVYLFL